MDVTELRAFVAVSRAGTIAEAANSLSLTSAPVSRAIARLEREIGGILFDRSYHRLSLTALGRRVLPHAVETLAQLRAIADPPPGPALRIGVTPWAPDRYAADLMAYAEQNAPLAPLRRDPSATLLHLLTHGDLDLALVHGPTLPGPAPCPGVSTRSLAQYHFTFFVASGHPLTQRTGLRLRDLAGTPLAIAAGFHRRLSLAGVLRQLADAGVDQILDLSLDDWSLLPQRVRDAGAMTLGSTLADTPMARLVNQRGLVPLRLTEEGPRLALELAWRTLDGVTGDRVRRVEASVRPLRDEPVDELR